MLQMLSTAEDSASQMIKADDSGDLGLDPKLRRLAEMEMRRSAEPLAKKMKPTIDLGRFDYGAPVELEAGTQGFILTSIFDREKSAMKEAVRLLSKSLAQRGLAIEREANGDETTDARCFSSIKLAGRGMCCLRMCWEDHASASQTEFLAQMAADVQQLAHEMPGSKPRFLRRVSPFQATCGLATESVEGAIADLAKEAEQWEVSSWSDKLFDGESNLRFAVAFRPRTPSAAEVHEEGASPIPDRAAIITAAARGLEVGLRTWVKRIKLQADLTKPDVVVLIEQLPVAGYGSYLGVALLPGSACTVKPRLAIKGLA